MPLSGSERSFFGPRFGADFSRVRLHTGERASELANAIRAKAFTAGHNIYFSSEYSAAAPGSMQLLAHELTHVVQQKPDIAQSPGSTLRFTRCPDAMVQREEPKKEQTVLEKLDAELNELWPDDADILSILDEMNSTEKQKVIADYQNKIAKELSNANMVQALDTLGADYATRRAWLTANKATVHDVTSGGNFAESAGECKLDPELKTRVQSFSEYLLTHLLAWKDITLNQGCRLKATAHRWSTAYHILNGYVSLGELQSHLPPESKGGGEEKKKDESSDQVKDLDGNVWYGRGWTIEQAKAKATENYDNSQTDKPLAYEGYEVDDPHRKPNASKPPVSQHVYGQAIDASIGWNADVAGDRGDAWSDLANKAIKQFQLKRPIDSSNPYGPEKAEPWHYEKA